jgi:ribosomal-protein-alanine N-acetyltransferase
MRRRHLRAVLAIEEQVYDRAWSASLFEGELERRERVYLVARVGPRVVAYAGLVMIADDGHVATVAVDPAWQRRHIATRLLVELVRGAMELGANQLTLEVRASDTGAQELYRSFGFAPAGVRKGYYGHGEDAIVMWAHDVRLAAYTERLAVIEAGLHPTTDRRGFATSTTATTVDPRHSPGHPPGHPTGAPVDRPPARSSPGPGRMGR